MFYCNYRYQNRPAMSGFGLYDPTSIMNADTLNKYQREGWIKLAFYLFSFFYYLYGCVAYYINLITILIILYFSSMIRALISQ